MPIYLPVILTLAYSSVTNDLAILTGCNPERAMSTDASVTATRVAVLGSEWDGVYWSDFGPMSVGTLTGSGQRKSET